MRNPAITSRRSATGALLAALCLAGAPAWAGGPDGRTMPVETLKTVYLDCARRAAQQRQDTGDVMLCSTIYEALKARAFDGDFSRMRAWTDAQLGALPPVPPAADTSA